MDIKFFLDNYRKSLLTDPQALRILSHMYRDGPIAEDSLSSLLGEGDQSVSAKLTELYRAGLVRLTSNDGWYTTKFAEDVLSRLNISAPVSKHLLWQCDLPETDTHFLNACINVSAEADPVTAKNRVNLLKSARFVLNTTYPQYSAEIDTRRRLLYAVVVGLDPDSQRLGGRNYCNAVMEMSQLANRDRNAKWLLSGLEAKCETALHDVWKSNELLLFGRNPPSSEKWPVMSLSWVRALNTLSTEEPDPQMLPSMTLPYMKEGSADSLESAWEQLAEWNKSLRDHTVMYLHDYGGAENVDTENFATSHHQILNALQSVLSRRKSLLHLDLCETSPSTMESYEASPSQELRRCRDLLFRVRAGFQSGRYDSVSASERDSLLTALGQAYDAVNTRSPQEKPEPDFNPSR